MHYKFFTSETKQWVIVICWILTAIACACYLPFAGKPFKIENISDPTVQSSIARNSMIKEFPYSGSKIFVLYKSKNLHTYDSAFESEVRKSLNGAKNLPFENRVTSPYKNTKQISTDKHAAYAVIETNLKAEDLANHINEINSAFGNPKKLQMFIGGEPSYTADIYKLSEENLRRGELIALPICLLVMIIVFSGVMAALLTIFTGIINITIIIAIIYLLGHQIDLTVFVLNIATMLGLGLGLDYTLLITYRFREEYAKCYESQKAVFVILSTAGKSVLFSGIIVFISIASLIFFPINILYSIGVGGVVVVAVTLLSSVTFLPAMLCLFEKYITSSNASLKRLSSENVHDHRWFKFANLVMEYPVTFLIPTICILVILGYPFIDVKINSSDAKILPTWTPSRQLMEQFDSSFNANDLSPINIVLKAKNNNILSKTNISAIYDYVQILKKDKRVKSVGSIVTIKEGLNKQQYQQLYRDTSKLPFTDYQKQVFNSMTKGKYTLISVISKYSKDDNRNFELVHTLRDQTVKNGISKVVGGRTSEIIDMMNIVYDLFIKIVIFISIVTYCALFWLLRSIILPLKAIIMNFLSLSVCYGMLVFIFQQGHFSHFLHFTAVGFTDLNLPILLFFVLFGLSMDYEVFLLTRIKEYYEKTGDNAKSVALGLERSARVITSAALILIIVTSAFVSADIIFIKAFGLGTALAIAIDASLIRLLLVPATMRLLGDWNWYIPKWIDRILPVLQFDKGFEACKINEKIIKNDKIIKNNDKHINE